MNNEKKTQEERYIRKSNHVHARRTDFYVLSSVCNANILTLSKCVCVRSLARFLALVFVHSNA